MTCMQLSDDDLGLPLAPPQVVELDPTNGRALYNWGACAMAMGQTEKAKELYRSGRRTHHPFLPRPSG